MSTTVFVAFFSVSPPISGAANVSLGLARYWPGHSVLIQPSGDMNHGDPEGVRVLAYNSTAKSRVEKLRSLRRTIKEIVDLIGGIQPDYIVLEGASWVLYHLLLLHAIRRSKLTAMVVYHGHNVEYILRREKQGVLVGALTRWAENRLLKAADIATAVSDVDREQIRVLYNTDVKLLPNGIDLHWLDSVTDNNIDSLKEEYSLGDKAVLFLGNYLYFPNKQAIDFLIKQVFPILLNQIPDAQLVIAGGNMPYNRPWLINAEIMPEAELPALIKCATVSAAPIFSGSGTRLKILESMACRVPVVSTLKGMEGLPLKDGQDIFIAEEAGEFAAKLAFVLENSDSVSQRLEPSFQNIRDYYCWESIVGQFIE